MLVLIALIYVLFSDHRLVQYLARNVRGLFNGAFLESAINIPYSP